MTALEYVEEVKLRLDRIGIIKDTNDLMILTHINRARRDVQKFTLDLLPHRYARITTLPLNVAIRPNTIIANTYQSVTVTIYELNLPIDFIKDFAVILNYTFDSTNYVRQVRYYTLNEMYKICKHAYNSPSLVSPVYSIIREQQQFKILIAGIDTIIGNNEYSNLSIDIWHTIAIKDLEYRNLLAEDNEIVLSLDIEELVILYAMYNCLQEINPEAKYPTVLQEKQIMENMIMQNYESSELVQKVELASLEK